jgi:two-component system cell cycle response regulator CpdR
MAEAVRWGFCRRDNAAKLNGSARQASQRDPTDRNLAFTNAVYESSLGLDEGSMAMARILLAEDDDSLRGFLTGALKRAGHDVDDFGDGEEALEALEGRAYDLLLTDIVMPGMDGIELARRAAEIDPIMKIVFITGFAAVALGQGSPAPREARVLSKPFHLRDLVAEVERVIAA